MVVNCSGAGENYIEQGGNRIQFIMFISSLANSKLPSGHRVSRPALSDASDVCSCVYSTQYTNTRQSNGSYFKKLPPSLQRIDPRGLTVDQPNENQK